MKAKIAILIIMIGFAIGYGYSVMEDSSGYKHFVKENIRYLE